MAGLIKSCKENKSVVRLFTFTSCAVFVCMYIMTSNICFAVETIVLDFESTSLDWQPVSKKITLSKSKEFTATESSKTSLRIQGVIKGDNIFAISNHYPMDDFQHYRLTARIRLHTVQCKRMHPDSDVPLPCLKCEFMTSNPKSSLGMIPVKKYMDGTVFISKKKGKWMSLTGEFRAPRGTKQCRLLLVMGSRPWVKPTDEFEIDFYLDDLTIEPIEHYTITGKYRLHPLPRSLEKMRGIHPRLYLTEKRSALLREKINTTHAPLWNEFRKLADNLAEQGPPEYRGNTEGIYDEQWWQVPVGNNMSVLAMAYVLSGDSRYLGSTREWALASCGYRTWGIGWGDGLDCIAGHHLFGLSLVYDWCQDSLDDETLKIIRETVIRRTSAMFDAAAKGNIVPNREEYRIRPWPEWDEAYLQNHLWVNTCGMAAAGLALFDEVDDASRWIGFTLDRIQRTMELLGPDGASHEGINYWSYGIEHLLKFMYLARDLLDVDMFDNEWFRNTATYRQYMSLPRNAWAKRNTTVNYADSYRKDSYGPDYQLRFLAGEYRDGHAQWLAQELNDADVLFPATQWLNLIWYDPTVSAQPPADLPTLYHFTDMDFVSARSDWSGDESFVFFKCGPYIGHEAIQEIMYCPSSAHHTHPDQNHFVLFGEGEWLIRDNENQGKYTGQHNTLMIDGNEQLGGGGPIFDAVELHSLKARPRIIRAKSTPDFDHMAGDATEAYPKDTGLKRFVRHLLYVKPDVLIVIDDISLSDAHELELRFIPEQQEAEWEGKAFHIKGKRAVLRLESLTGEGVTINGDKLEAISRRNTKDLLFTIRLRTRRAAWRNAVALSWSKVNVEPVKVTLRDDGNIWRFAAGDRTVAFNWITGKAELLR